MVAGRILVIEDDAEIAQGVVDILEFEGYHARWVHATEAAAQAEIYAPDVVLLDLVMPEVDGYEVARQLRANADTARIPIILMTAAARPDGAAARVGAADVLLKPFEVDDLLSRIRALQARSSSRRHASAAG